MVVDNIHLLHVGEGTGNRYNVVFRYLRQRSNGLRICLPALFYMYVFSWFHSV
jgi:hypothetical protein